MFKVLPAVWHRQRVASLSVKTAARARLNGTCTCGGHKANDANTAAVVEMRRRSTLFQLPREALTCCAAPLSGCGSNGLGRRPQAVLQAECSNAMTCMHKDSRFQSVEYLIPREMGVCGRMGPLTKTASWKFRPTPSDRLILRVLHHGQVSWLWY
jgi:hypothetical protein